MEVSFLYLVIFVISINSVIQGLEANYLHDNSLTLQEKLVLLNKPAVKSFVTEYGDILDCVDINKQLAFDHPLLKNHSIQMKPSKILNSSMTKDAHFSSHFIPKRMRCPRGTVPIKRVQEEDLLMSNNFSSILGSHSFSSSISSNFQRDYHHDFAYLMTFTKTWGASGTINVWNPVAYNGQFSAASIFLAKNDGSVSNIIQAGWMVSSLLYKNNDGTRVYGFWTRDSGENTGCFNVVCPGFVQVSRKTHLGQPIKPISEFNGVQYIISVRIEQDMTTKNWWLYVRNEAVGYWPANLFTSLDGYMAERAGWGGQVFNPGNYPIPRMGSGFKPNAGFSRSCFIHSIKLNNDEELPGEQDRRFLVTKPSSYDFTFEHDDYWHNHIYFGGPENF